MKQLFKLKFKMHKLVNIIFYLIIFIIGVLIGLGIKKFSFNNVLSKLLMIDSVSATTIYDKGTPYVDEDYVYNYFNNNFDDFDFNKYNNIVCTTSKDGNIKVRCYAFDNFILENGYIDSFSPNDIFIRSTKEFSYYYFSIDYYHNTTKHIKLTLDTDKTEIISTRIDNDTRGYITYSNFDFNILKTNTKKFGYSIEYVGTTESNLNNTISYVIPLDFSSFMKLEFNENLFKDNPNFKEVCIDKGKKYAVTSTNIDPVSNTLFVSDFMWFPGKTTGVKYSEYDSLNDDNILIYNDDISTENYYFKDRETIDSIFNDEITSNYFNHSGYTDKYSYYGYTTYKFIHSYYVDENNNPQNMFTIFDFSDINFRPFGSGGGSSSSFGDTPLKYCFYIKNEFNVTELKTDEWNDHTGVVPTPGGDLNVNTSYNKNHSNTNISLSQPIIFINSMKDTINLINSLIYEFYMSLPVLLRTFIITLFIILIIMLIMRIGGY